jgi:hypothetical protein
MEPPGKPGRFTPSAQGVSGPDSGPDWRVGGPGGRDSCDSSGPLTMAFWGATRAVRVQSRRRVPKRRRSVSRSAGAARCCGASRWALGDPSDPVRTTRNRDAAEDPMAAPEPRASSTKAVATPPRVRSGGSKSVDLRRATRPRAPRAARSPSGGPAHARTSRSSRRSRPSPAIWGVGYPALSYRASWPGPAFMRVRPGPMGFEQLKNRARRPKPRVGGRRLRGRRHLLRVELSRA